MSFKFASWEIIIVYSSLKMLAEWQSSGHICISLCRC